MDIRFYGLPVKLPHTYHSFLCNIYLHKITFLFKIPDKIISNDSIYDILKK